MMSHPRTATIATASADATTMNTMALSATMMMAAGLGRSPSSLER
jgi:hypothetical protein